MPAWIVTRWPMLCLPIEHHIRKQAYVISELAIRTQVVATHEDGARAHPHPRAQDAIRPDVRGRIDLGRVGDDGAGMDALRVFLRREEKGQHPGQSHPGVRHTNEDLAVTEQMARPPGWPRPGFVRRRRSIWHSQRR